MTTLDKIKQQTNYKPNAWFAQVLKDSRIIIGFMILEIKGDEELDYINRQNRNEKFEYRQISYEEYLQMKADVELLEECFDLIFTD